MAALTEESAASFALNGLGPVALTNEDCPRARQCYAESLALQRGIGDDLGVGGALINLGDVACRQGDPPQAEAHSRASLLLGKSEGVDLAGCLQGLAEVLWRRGEPGHAARLLGATAERYEALGDAVPVPEVWARYERVVGLGCNELGADPL